MSEQWLVNAQNRLKRMPDQAKEVRERALNELYFFAKLVNPSFMYGELHKEVYQWLQEYSLYGLNPDASSDKCLMLPRAHLKSHIIATAAAWLIARHPEVTMIYVSATMELATKQLTDIKNILESDVFQRYFPEYINPQEGKRTRWATEKISIDHPKRKKESVRDETIACAGLGTNTTGWHADIVLCDDVVVPDNAYTEEGRSTVSKKVAQFSSIRNSGGMTLACGTRYHPADEYSVWLEESYEVYNDEGIVVDKKSAWEFFERVVEKDGIFAWPRATRDDGKAYGFNMNELAKIRAKYQKDMTQFHAQYYNDPNDKDSELISRDKFQYYNPRLLRRDGSVWKYNGKRLNLFASVDFAFSLSKAADFTAIVVVGMDCDKNVFVLDIDRFKAIKPNEYIKHVIALHSKWGFKKLRAEVVAAQRTIVEHIKDHAKNNGIPLKVEDYNPPKGKTKEMRISAALDYKYENEEVWHTEGGFTNILEDELVMARPPHDD